MWRDLTFCLNYSSIKQDSINFVTHWLNNKVVFQQLAKKEVEMIGGLVTCDHSTIATIAQLQLFFLIKNSNVNKDLNIWHFLDINKSAAEGIEPINNTSQRRTLCDWATVWRRALAVAIAKLSKPRKDSNSYRLISLLCFPYKILERLIHALVKHIIDALPSAQCHTPLSGTVTSICKLLKLLHDNQMIRMIMELDQNRSFLFSTCRGRQSMFWPLKNGVPRGSVLALFLNNIYIHDIPFFTRNMPTLTIWRYCILQTIGSAWGWYWAKTWLHF